LKDGSEKGLVADAKAGDRKAFDQLVRMYKDKMFALIYRMTNDREAALDLLQETFFAAFKELRRFRYEAAFSSWLYRIAANKSTNYLRREKLIPFFSLSVKDYAEPAYEMSDNMSLDELNRGVAEAVASLPPKQRAVFNLRFYDKLSFAEIADIMQKKESTVKTNYQKAIEKLQGRLKDYK
jgi:RNA polymerase sigma-70 factor (ECF subfamily)